jgi:putative serine protease PepD
VDSSDEIRPDGERDETAEQVATPFAPFTPGTPVTPAVPATPPDAAGPVAPSLPAGITPPWWSRLDETPAQASADETASPVSAVAPSAQAPDSLQPADSLQGADSPQPADTASFATSPYAGAPADVIAGGGGIADTPRSDAAIADGGKPRRGVKTAAALVAAAVVVSAAASGVVVHIVDDHSGHGTSAAAAPTVATAATSSLPPAASVAADVKTALARIEPSVVLINDTITSSGAGGGGGGFGGFGGFQESGAGTGIVITADGEIVTNAHVVNGATAITVTLPNNGGTHPATLVGIDTTQDLAVIKISGVTNLKPATFANSDTAAVGDSVLAVGNALGYGGAPTVTEGILSAKGRTLTGTDDNLSNLLQTDAAINPGNSGGPLVDSTGQVIGINVAVASGTTSEPAQNIGFSIPSNTVVNDLPSLKAGKGANSQGGQTTQSGTFLGVSVADATGGALVQAVEPGSPAAAAGIQAGDLITSVDGKAIADGTALQQAIRGSKSGTTVTIGITRNGSPTTVKATLGTTQLSS